MKNAIKVKYVLFTLLITMLTTASVFFNCVQGETSDFMNLKASSVCVTPSVILESGVNGTSIVYVNKTSALIVVDANFTQLTYNYSLNIVNVNDEDFLVRLECTYALNITYVNATIILHNNFTASNQITINSQGLSQSNEYYILQRNSTIYVGIKDLIENSSAGKTILHVYLRIRVPNTSVYTLYLIIFEFI